LQDGFDIHGGIPHQFADATLRWLVFQIVSGHGNEEEWFPSHCGAGPPQRGEQVTVQIVVGGDNDPFELTEIELRAHVQKTWRFSALPDALSASRKTSFVVEFPKHETSETFSCAMRGRSSDAASVRSTAAPAVGATA
jgi:hypothetical protein